MPFPDILWAALALYLMPGVLFVSATTPGASPHLGKSVAFDTIVFLLLGILWPFLLLWVLWDEVKKLK